MNTKMSPKQSNIKLNHYNSVLELEGLEVRTRVKRLTTEKRLKIEDWN